MSETKIVDHGLPFATLSSRILAAFLDLVASYLLACIFMLLAVGLGGGTRVISTLSIVVPWLYFSGFEASVSMATPGKKHCGIVVTDAQGKRISFARASLRFLGKVAMLATMGLGLLICVFDKQRRGLDDFVASTRVFSTEIVAVGNARSLVRKAVLPVVVIAAIILLAKFALDERQRFRTRAALSGILIDARAQLQTPYEVYYENNKHAPTTADLPAFRNRKVRAVDVDANGNLLIQLFAPEGTIKLSPTFETNGAITWTCHAMVSDPSLFPSTCRN